MGKTAQFSASSNSSCSAAVNCENPRTAFDAIAKRGDLSWDQLMLIYQHHERFNGSGYPVGLCGNEVHDGARVCATVDVFDALTSERPYREPDSVEKTCDLLKRSSAEFDKEMMKCWIYAVTSQQ